MALDFASICIKFPAVLAGIRDRMVADSVQPRRPEQDGYKPNVHTVRRGHPRFYQLLFILCRNAAYDRVRFPATLYF